MTLDSLTGTKVIGLYVVPKSKFKDFTLGHRWTEKNIASKMDAAKKLCVEELKSRREQLRSSAARTPSEEDEFEMLKDDKELERKATGDAQKRIREEIHNKVNMFVIGIDFIKALQKKLPGIYARVNTC
mmetsp:Transcript_14160/g.19885  ORF Transcript_14160/g.19885 Transcript_14160/m.19885 type:complete len:129 (-) Transcript_14160:203-589(-)